MFSELERSHPEGLELREGSGRGGAQNGAAREKPGFA